MVSTNQEGEKLLCDGVDGDFGDVDGDVGETVCVA